MSYKRIGTKIFVDALICGREQSETVPGMFDVLKIVSAIEYKDNSGRKYLSTNFGIFYLSMEELEDAITATLE